MTKNIQKRTIWIAWEKHRRTIELCKHFEIELITFVSNRNRLIKHPIFVVKTICEIIRQKPHVLIVQNPSIVLTFIACIFKQVFAYKLIVDTHNAGILPESFLFKKLSFLYKYFQKNADITVVTNEKLKNCVIRNNGKPFIMPDKLPNIDLDKKNKSKNDIFKIACICTFGIDEPYRQLVESAGHFNNNIQFYVTGNLKKITKEIIQIKPENLTFTGFLPENKYWEMLTSADLIIDLTNREDCLVCGAYEAIAAEVPIVLSDTLALRNYFYKGTVFTKNTMEDIVPHIVFAIENRDILKREVVELKEEIELVWSGIADNFKRDILTTK